MRAGAGGDLRFRDELEHHEKDQETEGEGDQVLDEEAVEQGQGFRS